MQLVSIFLPLLEKLFECSSPSLVVEIASLKISKNHSLTDAVIWYVAKVTWGFVSFSSNGNDCLYFLHFFLDRFVDSKILEFLKNLRMTR